MTSKSPVWHPFTQHAIALEAITVARGSGAYLESADGDLILDAISSWWVITHGHCHPRIAKAVREQAERLDQVIFAGFTHEPAEKLARALIELTPPQLTRVFYSDSGSTAVEVALKMALGYWRNVGSPRPHIVALEHAYHGDTIGTMSAGARGVFNAAYEPLLFDVKRLPFPAEGREQETLDAFEAICRTGGVAALIVEPLILGAGGMLMWRAATLVELRRICERYDVLLIADEVMTGWGCAGTLFACEQAGVAPDILCLAKGISGGHLPLAATLCADRIFDAHYSLDRSKTFYHSSSYTANPIACAAAVANVEIWREEPVLERVKALCSMQERHIARLGADNAFSNVRRAGTVTAIDVVVDDGGYLADIGPALYEQFLARGVLLRPLGNTVYVMPPYCITSDQLDCVYAALINGVEQVLAGGRS